MKPIRKKISPTKISRAFRLAAPAREGGPGPGWNNLRKTSQASHGTTAKCRPARLPAQVRRDPRHDVHEELPHDGNRDPPVTTTTTSSPKTNCAWRIHMGLVTGSALHIETFRMRSLKRRPSDVETFCMRPPKTPNTCPPNVETFRVRSRENAPHSKSRPAARQRRGLPHEDRRDQRHDIHDELREGPLREQGEPRKKFTGIPGSP